MEENIQQNLWLFHSFLTFLFTVCLVEEKRINSNKVSWIWTISMDLKGKDIRYSINVQYTPNLYIYKNKSLLVKTNQDFFKVPKFLIQRMRYLVYQTLKTSLIYSQMSLLSLIISIYFSNDNTISWVKLGHLLFRQLSF